MQKKIEIGKVRMMRMMEKVISRIEQQSGEDSASSFSLIATIYVGNDNVGKSVFVCMLFVNTHTILTANASPHAWKWKSCWSVCFRISQVLRVW